VIPLHTLLIYISGLMVAAQYVYATVTGIVATDDGRVIATTKMGYVIVNKLDFGQSGRTLKFPKNKSSIQTRPVRQKSYRSARDSVTCSVL